MKYLKVNWIPFGRNEPETLIVFVNNTYMSKSRKHTQEAISNADEHFRDTYINQNRVNTVINVAGSTLQVIETLEELEKQIESLDDTNEFS